MRFAYFISLALRKFAEANVGMTVITKAEKTTITKKAICCDLALMANAKSISQIRMFGVVLFWLDNACGLSGDTNT